jgi:hypothetical protein
VQSSVSRQRRIAFAAAGHPVALCVFGFLVQTPGCGYIFASFWLGFPSPGGNLVFFHQNMKLPMQTSAIAALAVGETS